MAQAPDLPWTSSLVPDSRVTPEVGGGATFTKEKCSSFSHRPHPVPSVPALLPGLPSAPSVRPCHLPAPSSIVLSLHPYVCAHTFGRCRESRRVEGESGTTAFGPPTLSGTVFSCDRSVCTEVGSREGERRIPGALGCRPLRHTQGPPRQNRTDSFPVTRPISLGAISQILLPSASAHSSLGKAI